MAKNILFTTKCFVEYLDWRETDLDTFDKINLLISQIQRDPFVGIGKPEPLKGEFKGFWSRRIDQKNRLLYRVVGDHVEFIKCKGHYGDR